MLKRFMFVMVLMAGVLLVACDDQSAPSVSNDNSSQKYQDTSIPYNLGIFTVTGVVESPVQSLVRQTQAAQGSLSGFAYSGIGSVSGSYFGPEFGGKGFVRLRVENSDSTLAVVGSIVLLKSTDTKASILGPGDRVTFKCREQYEAVAAVAENEKLDKDQAATWELDFCRMVTPSVETTTP